ncbi:MAG: hypothetical protein JXR07_03340 [Reichenbachiella sp.]
MKNVSFAYSFLSIALKQNNCNEILLGTTTNAENNIFPTATGQDITVPVDYGSTGNCGAGSLIRS